MRLIIDNKTFYIIRRMYRLSMKEMADMLGISQTYVNRIEKELEPVTDNVRDQVVRAFGLNAEKLKKLKEDYRLYSV